jgi:hypothetical protein
VANSTVTFTTPATGASGTFITNTANIDVANTDVNGKVSIGIKANTKSGAFTATGGVTGIASTANFALTNIADSPTAIVTTSGSNQIAVVNQNFANNLVATVTDQYGNPVANSTVTFTTLGTGANGTFVNNAVTTDANGAATIGIKANTKAGSFTTTGNVGNVATGADFNLTNIADVAGLIVANSGSGQTTTVDQNFASNLVATVTDKFGNPIAGSTVTFSVPGSGASGVFASNSAVTDVNGTVSIGIKANTKSGAFKTTGKVGGVTTGADFKLTNTADVADSIVTAGGSNQLLIVSQRSTQALQTQILDRFGNPVPNTSVTFILPIDGASGSFANGSNRMTAITNANGIAILNFIANSVFGTYTAIAQIELPTGLKTTQFTLTNSLKTPYLELKKSPKPAPTIVLTKPILCVVREGDASVSDDYRGLSSCSDSNKKKASESKKSEHRRDR